MTRCEEFLLMSKVVFKRPSYTLSACILRELTQDEAATVSQTLVQMEPWRTLGYKADTLSNYLSGPDPLLYGIVASQQLVGAVCVRYPWLRGACLELLAVFPSQQGRGLGRDVIGWLEAELLQTNCRNLWTLVSSFNQEARHFYQQMGFVEVGQLDDLIVTGYAEILLRKYNGLSN
jgi:ribosomal protein S18 acetylase RimI-like enzyme